MRTRNRRIGITAFLSCVALRTWGGQWPCADDFNDGVRDENLWTNVVVISGGDAADLMETNSRVRFVRDDTNDMAAIAFQPLCAAIPASADWEAQVRVHVPSVISSGDEAVLLGLGLTADSPVQSGKGPIAAVLANTDWAPSGHLYMVFFDFAACPSNTYKSKIHDEETGTDGWVRLRWRAAVSNLYADYTADTNRGWRALGGPRNNPLQVAPSNSFRLGLLGGSGNRAVSSGDDLWLDDFSSSTNPFWRPAAAAVTNVVRESTSGVVRVWFSSRFDTVYDLEWTANLTATNGWGYNNLPAVGDVGPLGLAWASATTGACGFVRVTSTGVDAVITNFSAAENLLDTPERIRQYMQGHIDYCGNWDDPESYHVPETNDAALAPANVFARGRGDCRSQSALFAYLLNHHDDAGHSRFDVHTVRFDWYEGPEGDHCIAVFKDTDGRYRYFTDSSVYGPLDPTNVIMDALCNFERQRLGFATLHTNRVYEAPTDPNSNFVFDFSHVDVAGTGR